LPCCCAGVSNILCLLLAGSDNPNYVNESFRTAKSIAHNWVELMTGLLLWKFPTLQPQLHLKHLVQQATRAMAGTSRQSDEEFLDFFEQVG
jgi:hypothetical protein